MKKKLVCVGECMLEVSPAVELGTYKVGFAGDTFNTAWYVRRLLSDDWDVAFATIVGTDHQSAQFIEFCRDAGLDTSYICQDSNKTMGLYMVHLNEGERSFSYWRSDSAAKRLADSPDALRAAFLEADQIYYSGISIAILGDKGRANLMRVLKDAREAGKQILFDPNLRPKIWHDTEQMTTSVAAFARISDVVFPSFDDEALYFGDRTPMDTVVRYQSYGARQVILKNGPEQIIASDVNNIIETFKPTKISMPIDTTAAGDSFNAGFLAAVNSGESFLEAVSSGAKLACEVVQIRGALVEVDPKAI